MLLLIQVKRLRLFRPEIESSTNNKKNTFPENVFFRYNFCFLEWFMFGQAEKTSFGTIRSYFWPVHAHEARKLLPMVVILALVVLNYTILRNLKDSLVITAEGSGAEVIPFIKLWVMFPAAVGSAALFSYLLNRFSRSTVFQSIIIAFLLFFTFFCYFIYPNKDFLHPTQSADFLEGILPLGCKGLIAMYRNWTLTVFYVVSELWGSMVLQVLVWGFANEITKVSEAPRFYGVMVIASNTATVCAGQVAVALSGSADSVSAGEDVWVHSLTNLLSFIVVIGFAVLMVFRWMNARVLTNPEYVPQETEKMKKEKKRLSFTESLACLTNSKYLLSIATVVVSYNLLINLVEVIWKDRLRLLYPATNDFNIYINNLVTITGVVSTITSIVLVGVIHRLGWTITALLTPIILLVTAFAFFACIFAGDAISPFALTLFNTTPLAMAVFFGSFQNCFSKAAKYSIFDVTKEMAFIPLDKEEKMKGKAAIDGVGSRMAKSGGAAIHQGLLLAFGTLTASAPYVSAIVFLVAAGWMAAVYHLGKQFKEFSKEPDLAPVTVKTTNS
jgi:AAA family ATP:ADP antiporter